MKKGLLNIALSLMVLSLCNACFRKDVQTLSVQVPGMKTETCASLIKNAFTTPEGPVEGVLQVNTDVESRMVYVTYDSRKTAIKNIEYTIVHLGFEANGHQPRDGERNRLPEECR